MRVICLLSFLAGLAQGHGAMSFPKSRNVILHNYCPHCANGQGVCGDGSGSQWTTQNASERDSIYTTPLTKLVAGGKLEASIYWTVAHYGVFAVELCDQPAGQITEACFKRLYRDPTDVAVSPYLPDSPAIFFLPENRCVMMYTSARPLKARFIVPENVNSEHAVIRYNWNTGNSCGAHPASNRATVDPIVNDWTFTNEGVTCKLAISALDSCGADCPSADCNGEKFKNCADVAVVHGDPNTIVTADDHEIYEPGVVSTTTTTTNSSPSTTTTLPATTITSSSTLLPSSALSTNAPVTTSTTLTISTNAPVTTSTTLSLSSTTSLDTTATTSSHSMSPSTLAATVASTTETLSEQVQSSAASTSRGRCSAVDGSVQHCKDNIESPMPHYNDLCLEYCDTKTVAEPWCVAAQKCDLTECIVSFYSNVCRMKA